MFLIVVKVVCKTRPYENNILKKSKLPMPIRLNFPATGAGLFMFLIVVKVVCKTRPYENNILKKSKLLIPIR
jgi:hypothetical protein